MTNETLVRVRVKVLKSFRRTARPILAKFSHFYYIKQIDNILPLSVQS